MQTVSAFFVSIILFVSVAKLSAYQCRGTEVHFLESGPVYFECACGASSVNCSWSRFNDREHVLRRVTNGSRFEWQRSIGFGQFICVDDDFNVEEDILILSQSENTIIHNSFYIHVKMGVAGSKW